jgi:hypothetical protein
MTALVPIQNLRSGVANKRPVASGLAFGQIAVNYNEGDPAVYLRGHSNALVKVSPVFVGSGAPNAIPASGGASGNALGETWLDNALATYAFKVWDGDSWEVPNYFPSGLVANGNVSLGTVVSGTWQGTAVGLVYGGTGAATASGARSNLGLVIGTDVQAFDADTAKTDVVQSFTAAQRGTVATIAGSGTVTPDFAIANNFEMVLSGTTTLAFPSGVASGQSGAIRIEQGNNFVISYSGAWEFPGSTPPSNTTVSGASDLLVYYAHSATAITAQLLLNVG